MKEEIEKYLNQFERTNKFKSIEPMQILMKKIGNPQNNYKIIHIAGTNGKGSVLEMMNSILLKQGYRVGKFISPHLAEFNERICVNNKPISDDEMKKILKYINPIIQEYNSNNIMKIRHFDVITCMALIYFAQNKCDFVLLETGMGGTYDSTNVVTPIISIITSIGYDHTKTLGSTLQEIASHKAGIIKPKSDTIFLELENKQENTNVLNIIKEKCKKEKSTLHIIKRNEIKNYRYGTKYQYFDYSKYSKLSTNLKGKIQIYNSAICVEVANLLNKKGYKVSNSSIKYGLKNVVHLGRFEILNKKPTIIYDGAHNVPAIQNFIKNMEQYYKNYKKVYIISILSKKDYKNILSCFSQDKESIIYVTSGNDKNLYESKEELYKIGLNYIESKRLNKLELNDAIYEAIQKYSHGVISIIGTFYIYGNVKEIIKKINIEKNGGK